MLLDRLHFEYEKSIRDLHNHLYGNANIRTPEGIATEVLKVIKTLMYSNRLDSPLSSPGSQEILQDRLLVGELASETRRGFDSMNRAVQSYPPDTSIALDDASIAATRAYLAGFDFSQSNRDWLGDAIEIFRSITAKRIGGQFFTHPLVTELAIEMLGFDPSAGDELLDICSGSGGFLITGSKAGANGAQPETLQGNVPSLIGLDTDEELVRLANSNLSMLSGTRTECVLAADSLADPTDWPVSVRERVVPDSHRFLASNPPFGSRITVKDRAILGQYDLARRWSRTPNGWEPQARIVPRAPEVLFIERNLRLAEPGRGVVALVTPYQILSGPQAGFTREWILRNAIVRAVIDLPAETFQPHTGTKASLLVLERRSEPLLRSTDSETYPIFMAVSADIGHDRRGNPIFGDEGEVSTDIPQVLKAFKAFRSGKDPHDVFSGARVVESLDINESCDLRLNAAFHSRATADLKKKVASFASQPGWRVTTIGTVTDRIFVPGRFKRTYVDNGIPFLSGTAISQVIPTNPKHLAPDDPNAQSCVVHAGWVLVTRSGSTGLISSVPDAWDGWAVSDHVIRVVPDYDLLPGSYLQAYLRSAIGQALLNAGIFGSVIDEITPEHIGSLPIAIPTDSSRLQAITSAIEDADASRSVASVKISEAVEAIEVSLAA